MYHQLNYAAEIANYYIKIRYISEKIVTRM